MREGPEGVGWSTEADQPATPETVTARTGHVQLPSPGADDAAGRVLRDLAFAAAGIGSFDWDLVTGVLTWDDRLIALFGYDEASFDHSIEAFNARVHPADRAGVEQAIQRAIRVTGEYEAEYRVVVPGSPERWVAARGRALRDEHGTSVRLLGAAYDITAGRAASARAEHEVRRAQLLDAVTGELTGTLDAAAAVARLAQVLVPALADWCVVTLLDDTGTATRGALRTVGSWHGDPGARPLVAAYAQARLAALSDDFVDRTLGVAEPQVLTSGATAAIKAVLEPGPAHALIDALAPDCAALLPLRGRDRAVGALTLFSSAERGPMTPESLAIAADVATRAGLALDNARLYRQQQHLAEGLQRSMLTMPALTEHLRVAVRYAPAAETAQVGGDWYDAFAQPSGATVVVIGDVVGHDTEAAAAMSQVRSMLRALAVVDDGTPAQILRRLDHALSALGVDTTATAVVARVEQTAADRAAGRARLRWSNAGHPPAMLLHPDGRVEALSEERSDLLLGIDPATARRDTETVLEPGATLLLYTDGLVERRDQPLEDGLARLSATLHGRTSVDPDALCDDLLARLLPARPDDDVAIVAVQLRP